MAYGATLRVRDLIKLLETMPPDAEVIGFDTDHSDTCSVQTVTLARIKGQYAEDLEDGGEVDEECVCCINLDTSLTFYNEDSDDGDSEEVDDDE